MQLKGAKSVDKFNTDLDLTELNQRIKETIS